MHAGRRGPEAGGTVERCSESLTGRRGLPPRPAHGGSRPDPGDTGRGSLRLAGAGQRRAAPPGPDESLRRRIEEITSEDLAGDYPAVEYSPPHGRYSLDILARLGEAFRYEDLETQQIEVDGIAIRVATPRMLYNMKRGTVRPLDRLIRERFGLEEEDD